MSKIVRIKDKDGNALYPITTSDTQKQIDTLKADKDSLEFLGWTIPDSAPSEFRALNYKDSNGVFHQKVGRVDLGSLTWIYLSGKGGIFETSISAMKSAVGNTSAKVYCTLYNTPSVNNPNVDMANKEINTINYYQNEPEVNIRDDSYSANVTNFKSAMNGTYLYYELATEVTMTTPSVCFVETKFPTTAGNSVVCAYPSGFNKDNSFAEVVKFKYSTNGNWYTFLPYFTHAGSISINTNMVDSGFNMFINGTSFSDYSGNDIVVRFTKYK